jgi:hypothetical protein
MPPEQSALVRSLKGLLFKPFIKHPTLQHLWRRLHTVSVLDFWTLLSGAYDIFRIIPAGIAPISYYGEHRNIFDVKLPGVEETEALSCHF